MTENLFQYSPARNLLHLLRAGDGCHPRAAGDSRFSIYCLLGFLNSDIDAAVFRQAAAPDPGGRGHAEHELRRVQVGVTCDVSRVTCIVTCDV